MRKMIGELTCSYSEKKSNGFLPRGVIASVAAKVKKDNVPQRMFEEISS
jgi:hypothetical protein